MSNRTRRCPRRPRRWRLGYALQQFAWSRSYDILASATVFVLLFLALFLGNWPGWAILALTFALAVAAVLLNVVLGMLAYVLMRG